MKFTEHRFSKRFPPVECFIFVLHESMDMPEHEYRATGAAIVLPSGTCYVGVSVCSPEDQFVKAVGRQKATGRAYKNYRFGKDRTTDKPLQAGKGYRLALGSDYSTDHIKNCILMCIEAKKQEMGVIKAMEKLNKTRRRSK